MAWSDYPKDIRPFASLVRDAAQATFGSAQTIAIVAAAAAAADVKLGFQSFAGIAKLYGDFVAARNTASNYAASVAEQARHGGDFAISANMISRQPWSPAQSGFATNPFVLVRATFTQETPEGLKTGHFSHRYSASDLHTNAQLRADLQLQIDNAVGESPPTGAQLGDVVGIEWSTP